MEMLYLSLIVKPLTALVIFVIVRYVAIWLKPHIPKKWHAALYTHFTDYALEGQRKLRESRRESGR